MNRAAIIFLVLLRLAIGWHFFVEGAKKVESVTIGETTTNKPFNSAGYFREAPGPAGSWARSVLGDPNEEAEGLLIVAQTDGKDDHLTPPNKRTPVGLKKKWNDLLAKYQKRYSLDDAQTKEAQAKITQAQDQVVLWLTQSEADASTPEQTRKFPSGEIKRRIPTAERIRDYETVLADYRDRSGRKLWLFGDDVEKAELRQLKGKLTGWRSGLLADLNPHNQALIRSLNLIVAEQLLVPLEQLDNDLMTAKDLLKQTEDKNLASQLQSIITSLEQINASAKTLFPLTAEQVKTDQVETPIDPAALLASMKPAAETLLATSYKMKKLEKGNVSSLAGSVHGNADALGRALDSLPGEPEPPVDSMWARWTKGMDQLELIDWINGLTRWGLVVLGGCLLIGLFSRTSAWLGAGFLLMTYLAYPPWPWLPTVGVNEGTYLFVNKNLIEMLALCVLGTIATGRWFGVDAIFYWIWTSLFGADKK